VTRSVSSGCSDDFFPRCSTPERVRGTRCRGTETQRRPAAAKRLVAHLGFAGRRRWRRTASGGKLTADGGV